MLDTGPSAEPTPADSNALAASLESALQDRPSRVEYDLPPPFVTRYELTLAITVAIVTALFGFTCTWRGWQSPSYLQPPPLDRRHAESGVASTSPASTSVSFQAPAPGEAITYVPYSGGGGFSGGGGGFAGSSVTEDKPPLPIPAIEIGAAPSPVSTPSSSPSAAAHAPPSPNRPSVVVVPRVSHATLTERPPLPAPPVAAAVEGRLWPPPNPHRHATLPLETAFEEASPALVWIQAVGGTWFSGIVLDNSGLMVTRWSSLPDSPTVPVNLQGHPATAEVLGGLEAYDVAVLRIPRGDYNAPPLALEPPPLSDPLIYAGGPTPRFVRPQRAIPLGDSAPFPPGYFNFLGVVDALEGGAALINRRGEVAAMVLGKPWSYPGSSLSVAVDAGILFEALTAAREKQLSQNKPTSELLGSRFRSMLLQTVARTDGRLVASSALPGLGVGAFRLGTPLSQVQRELSIVTSPATLPDNGFSILRHEVTGLDLVFADDRIVAIRTTSSQFSTNGGVAVGALLPNIDLRRELQRSTTGEWGAESYAAGPGISFWFRRDGTLSSLTVDALLGNFQSTELPIVHGVRAFPVDEVPR